jgi:hypothetical protein
VTQISTVTNQVVGAVGVGSGPSAIAYGFGFLWITNESDNTQPVQDPPEEVPEKGPYTVRALTRTA